DRFNKVARQKHTLKAQPSDNTALSNNAMNNEEVIPLEESEKELADF
ncbi:MAG: hypothetical protein GY855_12890, partial [candidate division Zixibacteria bacterium]|nr:hypothetical protein [candidate division Zixibacteria bacterium]